MTEPASFSTDTSGTPFRRVLIGTDFSAAADHALAVARLRFPDALRRLVHVTDARVTAAPDLMGGVTPAALDPALLHTLEEEGSQRLRILAAPDEEAELLVGDPVTGVLDAAEHWGADLIVVGTHSKGALEHFFLGSSAEKLVARSPVPVLTVRLPGGTR
ncbi:universal stress protein [Deinococcus sp. MIMF12]|uniref:Universal stress protein n=1 Tax=Deinococcus rhizophilus TaxID=3049544 RepID=A0ABT7JDF6_9DEIO|nr:universal stress protein [Deinococcus rhizophilus]MDL2343077.1 universal stress protein [Deinococcus rhizophilus]